MELKPHGYTWSDNMCSGSTDERNILRPWGALLPKSRREVFQWVTASSVGAQ